MKDLYLISTDTLQYPFTSHRSEGGKIDIKRGYLIHLVSIN